MVTRSPGAHGDGACRDLHRRVRHANLEPSLACGFSLVKPLSSHPPRHIQRTSSGDDENAEPSIGTAVRFGSANHVGS